MTKIPDVASNSSETPQGQSFIELLTPLQQTVLYRTLYSALAGATAAELTWNSMKKEYDVLRDLFIKLSQALGREDELNFMVKVSMGLIQLLTEEELKQEMNNERNLIHDQIKYLLRKKRKRS